MTAALEYLRLPTDYGETLGAFRWSSTGDCVEYADGRTFVFQQELTQFLEGFASRRPLIAFPYILHLLHLFGKGRGHSDTPLIGRVFAGSDELSRAFARTGRPLRNAGAFCALLCQHVPSPAQPPELQAVCGLLASGLHVSQSGGDAARKAETPPLGPLSFEAVVAHALRPYSAEDLDHWLRTASDSVKEEAERVGRELLVRKPPTLSELLNEIGKRERWSGALPFVAQMIGALALPPRRLARQQ
jgi:hypothetical protein